KRSAHPAKMQPDATTTAAVKAMKAKAPKKTAVDDDEDEAQPMPRSSKAPATGGFKPVEKAKPVAALKTKAAKPADDDDEDDVPAAPKAPVKAAAAKAAEPVRTAKVEAPKAHETETTGSVSSPEFRWPARGRVILGYGSKSPSGANEGINIALPEGTPVKASEGGVVAYAGEEIRGYGKMVLIRHANGYVSAYAHNGDLAVKRGETVKRGQTIARSGQSGNVTSPQLHFELRKGSDPVDPTRFLE
ncbi:MAG: M23 family metallopeptidase, partial [Proteobacteria bacterium]|nr:M23 family metallopeptidase [Pseudomonadota bacterium]